MKIKDIFILDKEFWEIFVQMIKDEIRQVKESITGGSE